MHFYISARCSGQSILFVACIHVYRLLITCRLPADHPVVPEGPGHPEVRPRGQQPAQRHPVRQQGRAAPLLGVSQPGGIRHDAAALHERQVS